MRCLINFSVIIEVYRFFLNLEVKLNNNKKCIKKFIHEYNFTQTIGILESDIIIHFIKKLFCEFLNINGK